MKFEDQPYALKSSEEKARRMALVNASHIAPLMKYLETLKMERGEGYEMPNFDPCDGGVQARVLFLLEAPGPKAVGSSFISRNNPDPTARNMHELLLNANINRGDTLIWNVVPWYVGDGKKIRAVNSQDLVQSTPYLRGLIHLLPRLEVIVLVGKKAQLASRLVAEITNKPIVHTFHPSAQVFNVWPEKKRQTQEAFHDIARMLADSAV